VDCACGWRQCDRFLDRTGDPFLAVNQEFETVSQSSGGRHLRGKRSDRTGRGVTAGSNQLLQLADGSGLILTRSREQRTQFRLRNFEQQSVYRDHPRTFGFEQEIKDLCERLIHGANLLRDGIVRKLQ